MLHMQNKSFVAIVGENPTTTIIKWFGGSNGTMLWADGVPFCEFGRLTLDGSGTAGHGVDEKWNWPSVGAATTGTKYFDMIFQDMKRGIVAGAMNGLPDGSSIPDARMDSEGMIIRCRFYRMSEAGYSSESGNALDWFIWDSYFQDNARGATNNWGQGNFHVYRCTFQNSSVADLSTANTQYFGVRFNVSYNSQMFWDGGGGGNNEQVTFQGNRIISPKQSNVIHYFNYGPKILLDNQIQTPGGTVITGGFGGGEYADLMLIGNQFTTSSYQSITANTARVHDVDTSIVAASGISQVVPGPVAFPSKVTRQTFEISAGASAATIQTAINNAVAYAGSHPIVHLPAGSYNLGSEIDIPANLDVEIIGDARSTTLNWSGNGGGTMFKLLGPSKATFRDLQINAGTSATAFWVSNADQAGSRVYGEVVNIAGATSHNVYANGLNNTQIDFHQLDHGSSNSSSLLAVGGSQGLSGTSRIAIFGGASSVYDGWQTSNTVMYDVQNNARIIVDDTWYEGASGTLVNLTGSGQFSLDGGNDAPYSGTPGQYSIIVNGFNGTATFAGINMWFSKQFLV
jgi:hypothetical protein